MNDVFVRHIAPFTQLLNLKSRFLIERMYTFTIKDLNVLFAHASFHIELYTSLNIKENNWNFVMMSVSPKNYYIEFLLKSINPSCAKVFGTHTFYGRGGGGVEPNLPPMISKTVDSTNFNFGRALGLSMRGKKPVELMI